MIVLHFRFGVYSVTVRGGWRGVQKKTFKDGFYQATGRSGWTSGVASSRRERCLPMWPIERAWSGKLWPLSCFIVDGATQLAAGGEGRGAQAEGRRVVTMGSVQEWRGRSHGLVAAAPPPKPSH